MFAEARDLLAPPAEGLPLRMPLAASSAQFSVYVTRSPDELREAQQLRYKVFTEEMDAHLPDNGPGIDEDIYDRYCDHLIVRDNATLKVVGTYRILPPHAAKELGYYSDTEFFTTRLNHLKPLTCEFGRSCVHRDYRSGPVIMHLWAGLAQYMVSHGHEHVIGCASISMRDGGHQAASLFNSLKHQHMAPEEYRVFPRNPLPLERLHGALEIEAPALIKGYLRIGAMICGDPAWDPDFNSADFFMLLSLSRMNRRYARHFGIRLAEAAVAA
jgi:putative hemolysin